MIRYYFRKLGKSERGAAMVEFAIIAMLFFALIFGIIEFGWIFNGYITLEAAAKEGARLAIIGKTDQEIINAIKNHAGTFQIDNVEINKGIRLGSEANITVTATLPLLIGFFPFIGNTFEMEVVAYMLRES